MEQVPPYLSAGIVIIYPVLTPLTHGPCVEVAPFILAVSVYIAFIHKAWPQAETAVKLDIGYIGIA